MGLATARLGWALPEVLDAHDFEVEADELHHPFVADSVGNPIGLNGGEPMVFLTGPNMAGKTTYLRAAALALILGQVGMGVPAARARLTPVEVLLTSLNPADNLRAGLSFFFSEVLRVRQAAEHLAQGRRCFVLFDEVFKGTNVRDALEASTAVILGFAKARRSGFVFSSHLTELVDTLESEARIRFYHFDGRVVDGKAEYSYRVRPGVSDQRLGIHLLEQADIPELIAKIAAA
jgi:DNA mismatch repair ATPase MutS